MHEFVAYDRQSCPLECDFAQPHFGTDTMVKPDFGMDQVADAPDVIALPYAQPNGPEIRLQ